MVSGIELQGVWDRISHKKSVLIDLKMQENRLIGVKGLEVKASSLRQVKPAGTISDIVMPRPPYNPQSFDHFAERYDAATAIERRHDFFLENLPERRGRVLEIGCGTGLLAQELARHFESVLAVDISAPMLAIARARRAAPNIEYRLADAASASIEGPFDAIVSHTTLHHIADAAGTITRLKPLVAPRGRFLIVDVVDRWPWLDRSRAGLLAGACVAAGLDVTRHGLASAVTLFRFRISRPWLDHLMSDRYLSKEAFRQCYGDLLPGAKITCNRYFGKVVWEAAAPVTDAE
jgi:SAM-dependent methyltransferase